MGVLGAVGDALSAPQQALFKTVKGVGNIATGDFGEGFGELGSAVNELTGRSTDDTSATEALSPYGVKRLPKGLDTGLSIVADPLNVVTFGAGAAGKQALKTVAKELAPEVAEQISKKGLKSLGAADRKILKGTLEAAAQSKDPAKTAAKQMKALGQRGQGGVNVSIPFTDKGLNLMSGSAAGRIGEATGLSAAKGAVKASAPVRGLRRTLKPGAAVSEAVGSDAGERVLAAQSNRIARETTRINDLTSRLKSGVSAYEKTTGNKWTAADDAFVQEALESGDIAGAVAARPELQTVIEMGDDIRRTTTADQVAAGVLEEGGTRADDTYLHRITTPEADKAFKREQRQAVGAGASVGSSLRQGAKHARTVAEDLPVTAQQINSAIDTLQKGGTVADEALAASVKGLAQRLPAGTKLYQESALTSLMDRGQEAARAIASADYINDLRAITDDTGEQILLSADDLAKRAEALDVPVKKAVPAGYEKFELPGLGDFYAPTELRDEVMKFRMVLGDPGSVGKFVAYMDRSMKWAKGQMTASLPGGIPFGLRNARSNAWMTFVDGMPPTYFDKGRRLQSAVSKVMKSNPEAVARDGIEQTMQAHLDPADFDLWVAAREHGVIGEGFYDLDVPGVALGRAANKGGSKARKAVRFVAGSDGTLTQKGRAFNSAIEQNARLSHFMYSVERFGDVAEAARRTKAVLFDYAELTPFEQRVLKRVVPFYTFARKNVPAAFSRAIENPARVAVPEKLSNLATDPLDEDSPEYLKRKGARILKGGVPLLGGMVSTPERPIQAAVASLEPFAQLAAAAIPGKQGGIEPEKGFAQAARSLLSLTGGIPGAPAKALAQEAGGVNLFTGYKLAEGETLKRLLAEAMPALRRMPSLTARLPTAEKRRMERQSDAELVAEILSVLGFKVEPEPRDLTKR